MKSAIILSTSLAAVSAVAQVTGEYGRHMQSKGASFFGVMWMVLFVGLTLLVWLWVIKTWRTMPKRK